MLCLGVVAFFVVLAGAEPSQMRVDALILQALMAVGSSQERLRFLG